MLVGLDILGPEIIFIMMNNTEAVIKSCNNIRVPLTVHSWLTNQVKKTILSEKTISISSRSYATVNVVKTSLLKDWDLLFKSECQQRDSLIYAHIVDHTLSAVQVQNDTDMPLIILRKTCLSHVIEYEADECYLADLKDAELAASIKVNQANWIRTCFCEVLTAATAFYLETIGQPEWKIGHEVNSIWIKHHSGSSQSCHTLLPLSLRRSQQCDEGFWERVNEHSVNRWLRGQI